MKSGLAWMIVGIVIGAAFYPVIVEAQEYFGKFPPTPAWQQIEIANNGTFTPVPGPNIINATSYSDKFFFVTDGSILINLTQHP